MHTGSQYFDSILLLWLFTQFLFVTCRSLNVFVGMRTNLFLPPYYQKVQNCALGTTALGTRPQVFIQVSLGGGFFSAQIYHG